MSWESRVLGDVASLLSGGTPRKNNESYWGGNIPWFSAKDLKTNYLQDSLLHVTEEGASNGTRLVPENTVFFVVRGMSLANEFRVSLSKVPATFNQDLKAVRCKEGIVPEFLFYSLFAQRDRICQMAGEASHGTKKLPTEVMVEIPIKTPDTITQNRVVEVAEKYDLLIENNRRRIALLEESARLLYKEWFVHLRFPGHEHVRVVDGIPEGWEKTTADQVMAVMSGGTPKTTNPAFWDGGIPFFTPKDATDSVYVLATEKTLTEEGVNKCNSKLYPKDTLFITARGTVGKLNLAQSDMAMNQSCYALQAKDQINQFFLYCSLEASIQQFKARASGAVFDAIVVDTFKRIPFLIPEAGLIAEFTEYAQPAFKQVEKLLQQNVKLAAARDLLLPRLMNGEIEV